MREWALTTMMMWKCFNATNVPANFVIVDHIWSIWINIITKMNQAYRLPIGEHRKRPRSIVNIVRKNIRVISCCENMLRIMVGTKNRESFVFHTFGYKCCLRFSLFLLGPDGTLIHRCTCCPLYFATADETQKHQLEKHKVKLTCSYCNKIFKDPECVGAHVRYVHTKKAAPPKKYIYVCTKCGQ